MADMTNVDAGKLRQSASRIGSLAGELSGNVSKINEAINNLSKSWQSEAATKFLQNWHTDEEALREMVDQYSEISVMNLGHGRAGHGRFPGARAQALLQRADWRRVVRR